MENVLCRRCDIKMVELPDSNLNVCTNLRCKNNDGDKCPLCGKFQIGMCDGCLLYNCNKCNYMWSYHSGCPEISNPAITPSEFIGHLLAGDDFKHIRPVKDVELSENFVKSTSYNVKYADCSTFVWKCSICAEKYMNTYCCL